jgi:hypothetical protein
MGHDRRPAIDELPISLSKMRTLVFIFSVQSNRIITDKFWSTKMSQYFAVQNKNHALSCFCTMNGSLEDRLWNSNDLLYFFHRENLAIGRIDKAMWNALLHHLVSLCGMQFRFY